MNRQALFPILFSFTFLVSALSPSITRHFRANPDETYCNERFEFCAQIPNGYFTETIYADNGDGVILNGRKNRLTTLINGAYNIESFSAEELARQLLGDEVEPIFTDRGFTATYKTENILHHQRVHMMGDRYVSVMVQGDKRYNRSIFRIADQIEVEYQPGMATNAGVEKVSNL